MLDNTKGQSNVENPEKLATLGTRHKSKTNKTKTQLNMLDTTLQKQTQIT